MQKPTISVIMGIYNCASTLDEAIDSILAQTFSDWELIMCDDGSIDDTLTKANEYAQRYPSKIKVLRNSCNKGLNYSLNHCLKHATGKYIARMDGDDVCSPDRFKMELEILDSNPNISIVSTSMNFFDENGVWGVINHPEFPTAKDFIYGSPFCHAPCMVRKEAYDAVHGYTVSEALLRVEDYHLWIKMYQAGFRGQNIQIPLYQMRDDRNAYKRRNLKSRVNEFYVKIFAIKALKLPLYSYIFAVRPICVGLLPENIYMWLHKLRLKAKNK